MSVPARADLLDTLQIGFQNGAGSGSFNVSIPANLDSFQYDLASPVPVFNSGNVLMGTIKELSLTLDGDPGITLSFNMDATSSPTHVTITSAIVGFTPMINAQAFASAAVTVTDNDSSGATVTGLFPGTHAYQATYNGGTVFANLIFPVTAVVDGSNIGSDRLPGSGTSLIGAISSIRSQFDFMLSANDSASGTSRFNVTGGSPAPEPSTIALAAFGSIGLAAWGWRRRKGC